MNTTKKKVYLVIPTSASDFDQVELSDFSFESTSSRRAYTKLTHNSSNLQNYVNPDSCLVSDIWFDAAQTITNDTLCEAGMLAEVSSCTGKNILKTDGTLMFDVFEEDGTTQIKEFSYYSTQSDILYIVVTYLNLTQNIFLPSSNTFIFEKPFKFRLKSEYCIFNDYLLIEEVCKKTKLNKLIICNLRTGKCLGERNFSDVECLYIEDEENFVLVNYYSSGKRHVNILDFVTGEFLFNRDFSSIKAYENSDLKVLKCVKIPTKTSSEHIYLFNIKTKQFLFDEPLSFVHSLPNSIFIISFVDSENYYIYNLNTDKCVLLKGSYRHFSSPELEYIHSNNDDLFLAMPLDNSKYEANNYRILSITTGEMIYDGSVDSFTTFPFIKNLIILHKRDDNDCLYYQIYNLDTKEIIYPDIKFKQIEVYPIFRNGFIAKVISFNGKDYNYIDKYGNLFFDEWLSRY